MQNDFDDCGKTVADPKERHGRVSNEDVRQGSYADGYSQLGDS